ncbi:MAG: EscU/YscU/HrcU family type III secretion system export apparatus switch protein, partial [Desulfatitalea sp.]|nr:EscU/YscU/HrcU family type III secretion system export apparatus switch protein [Desulfatitalea sp.]NNK00932.1 EscU/YscU/HrcU family type III secretion system export apparatus switch protein [Desulfatitalea sp.]
MAEGSDQEKTEPATPKKRQEARRKGQVAKSREIPSVLVLLSALTVFYFAGSWMFGQLVMITRSVLQQVNHHQMGIESAHAMMVYLFQNTVLLLSPMLVTVALAGIIGNVSQVGFMLTGEVFQPKFSKLNPISGMKRLFSLRGLIELIKSLIKVAIIGTIAYGVLRAEVDQIPALVHLTTWNVLTFIGGVALKMGYFTCVVLIVLAGVDYAFQRWQYERDLRMTKQEVKDEYK